MLRARARKSMEKSPPPGQGDQARDYSTANGRASGRNSSFIGPADGRSLQTPQLPESPWFLPSQICGSSPGSPRSKHHRFPPPPRAPYSPESAEPGQIAGLEAVQSLLEQGHQSSGSWPKAESNRCPCPVLLPFSPLPSFRTSVFQSCRSPKTVPKPCWKLRHIHDAGALAATPRRLSPYCRSPSGRTNGRPWLFLKLPMNVELADAQETAL